MKICSSCNKKKPSSLFSSKHNYCKACQKAKAADWYIRNKKFSDLRSRTKRALVKQEVLAHYSSENFASCSCCGEKTLEFLVIDHVHGGGTQERKRFTHRSGVAMYYRLKKLGFPKGYRTLCQNCNSALGSYGYCPHHRPKSKTVQGFLREVIRHDSFKRITNLTGENNTSSVLNLQKVGLIRRMWQSGECTQGFLANKFDVSISAIAHIIHNRTWVREN